MRIDQKLGPVLTVSGLDLLDHTPLLISTVSAVRGCPSGGKNGFAEEFREFQIPVVFPEELQAQIPEHLRGPLLEVLAQDPRAAYNKSRIISTGWHLMIMTSGLRWQRES